MTTSENEWYNEWKQVTKSGNEWLWVTTNDSGATNENELQQVKQWF